MLYSGVDDTLEYNTAHAVASCITIHCPKVVLAGHLYSGVDVTPEYNMIHAVASMSSFLYFRWVMYKQVG